MQRAGTLRYVGPPRPGPLLNRPLGDKCSNPGKPSQANRGPKNRGRSAHQRLWYSNYGSRVDCFAWGGDISTCGGYPRTGSGSPQTAYMTDFAGTSGASAIVAGAAVLLQSWAAKHGGMLSTARLREVMSDPYINTPSSAPANDRIGVMPDLRGIIQHLRAPVRGRDDIIRAILFGAVAQDGPGFVWTPGGGLTPVGPRVDRTAQSQSRDK